MAIKLGHTLRKLRSHEKQIVKQLGIVREVIAELEASSLGKLSTTPPKPKRDTREGLRIWWNAIAEECGLPTVVRLSDKRWAAAEQRLSQPECADLDDLAKAIREQPFLRGANDRGWRLTFNALFTQSDMALKVIERSYLQTRVVGPSKPQLTIDDIEDEAEEAIQ